MIPLTPLLFLHPTHNALFHYASLHFYILPPAPSLPFLPSVCPTPPLSSLPEAMPVGNSGGLRSSVRGSGGSFSMHSLLQSYSSALRRPRSLGRSLSSYLNHTTRLGTSTHTHAHRGERECGVCVWGSAVGMGIVGNSGSGLNYIVVSKGYIFYWGCKDILCRFILRLRHFFRSILELKASRV